MTLIQSIQTWLKGYTGMTLTQISTDSTGKNAGSYALAPAGNSKTREDILGNKIYQNNYIFFAKETANDEVDRRDNYDFLESLSAWVEAQNANGSFPELPGNYYVEEIEVSNIMLFEIDKSGNGTYHIQIKVTIIKRRDT